MVSDKDSESFLDFKGTGKSRTSSPLEALEGEGATGHSFLFPGSTIVESEEADFESESSTTSWRFNGLRGLFPSENDDNEVRISSFLSSNTFFLGEAAILEAAEIVGDMKFFVPFETAGDLILTGFAF